MAVNRSFNFLGQQRVDIPHLRMIESAVCYDFDVIGLAITAGVPCIVNGFEVLNYTGLVGSSTNSITIRTANSRLIHPLASDSGSFFQVPSNRADEVLNTSNGRVQGSFTPSTTNYVGIDLLRKADSSTSSNVRFLTINPDTESNKTVPLARTMDYTFTISATPFSVSPSIAPVLIVVTDASNTIVSVTDARNLLFSNSLGGDSPTTNNPYSWPGSRNESTYLNPLTGGDRSIKSLKQWLNASMTRIQELGGGEYWYSLTADRNVRMAQSGVFSSTGEAFEWTSTNLHWKGIKFLFDNSTAYVNEIADQETDVVGLTDLADGECIYVDLDRTTNHTGASALVAQKTTLTSLGGSTTPGQRWTIAIRIGTKIYIRDQSYPVGSSFSIATTTHTGVIKTNLDVTATDPIAVTMVPLTLDMGGVAVASGISRAKLKGTVVVPDGDILVGYGSTQGDQNVLIRTTGNYGTTIIGNATDQAYLNISSGGYMGSELSSTNISKPGKTPIDIVGDCQFDGTKAWTLKGISVMPLSPDIETGVQIYGSEIPSLGQLKWFCKGTKVWKTDVRVSLFTAGGGTWTYNNTDKTIYYSTNSALVVDSVTLALNDRVLVNIPGAAYNGIYKATDLGGDSPAILTRTDDAGGLASATVLGTGYDLFDGVTVKVTAGTFGANKIFTLNCPNKNSYILTDGTQVFTFTQTDNLTADQFCIMFNDGSYIPVATGPYYEGHL